MSKGVSVNKIFSRSIEVPETGVLKLDFVNHKFLGKGTSEVIIRKPKLSTNDTFAE